MAISQFQIPIIHNIKLGVKLGNLCYMPLSIKCQVLYIKMFVMMIFFHNIASKMGGGHSFSGMFIINEVFYMLKNHVLAQLSQAFHFFKVNISQMA